MLNLRRPAIMTPTLQPRHGLPRPFVLQGRAASVQTHVIFQPSETLGKVLLTRGTPELVFQDRGYNTVYAHEVETYRIGNSTCPTTIGGLILHPERQ